MKTDEPRRSLRRLLVCCVMAFGLHAALDASAEGPPSAAPAEDAGPGLNAQVVQAIVDFDYKTIRHDVVAMARTPISDNLDL